MRSDLLWFKRDLRLDDNPALAGAAAAERLICVYCDPGDTPSAYGGFAKCGPARHRFLAEALADLADSLRTRGAELWVIADAPEAVIPELVAHYGIHTVWTQMERAPEEKHQLARVEQKLAGTGCTVQTTADNTLYSLDALPFALADMPRVFTKFRKQVEQALDNTAPVSAPVRLPPSPAVAPALADRIVAPERPATADTARFVGGETAGQRRLAYYLWESDRIAVYKKTRNGMLGDDYSSKFSPWLANGCLSVRRVADDVARYEREVQANKSTYWLLFELRWREFFHWIMTRAGAALFARGGLLARTDRPRATDAETLAAWREGRTGMPFVDANMRELAATGYMSNRGRQNVASYLARDLAQDWRWGAAWFEHCLVDYDVASNWGNWATVAGVGTDKRDNGFNVMAQATRYDADTAYISYWLPELAALPTHLRHAPWRADPADLAATGYPAIADVPSAWQGHLPDADDASG